MWNRKLSGLTTQFGALLLLAGTAAILLFCCLSFGGNAVMTRYFEDSGFQEKMTQRRIQDLQNYVSKQEVSAKDAAKLARWAKKTASDFDGGLPIQHLALQFLRSRRA